MTQITDSFVLSFTAALVILLNHLMTLLHLEWWYLQIVQIRIKICILPVDSTALSSLQFDVISPGVPHMLPSQQAVEPLASPAELLQISPWKTDSASSAILV